MKNKIIAGLLLITMLFVLGACTNDVAPLATPDDGDIVLTQDYNMSQQETENSGELGILEQLPGGIPTFDFVTGEVVNIHTNNADETFFHIEGENGAAVLMTYFNTLTLGDTPEVGDTVTGYFPLELWMTMIYPPQHMVSVIVNNDSFQDNGIPFVHVCRFYERGDGFGPHQQLISGDGELVVNIFDDTDIILQSGEAFDGELAGRMLVVTYAMNTFSIPAQTTPIQIIVLYERAVTGPEFVELPDGWEYGVQGFEPHYDIVVEGEGLVGAHVIFVGEDAIFPTHLELAPVAEALGAAVEWNRDTNMVTLEGLNGGISFVAGSYDFTVDGETVTLLQPSVNFYGTIYVPILFFRDVFGMASAYSQEGRFFISRVESDMH